METYKYDIKYLLEGISEDTVTLEDIKRVIQNVSIDMVSGENTTSKFDDDAVTYLYSGMINDYFHSNSVVLTLDNVRILDKTAAAYLLNNDQFKDLIEMAFFNDIKNRVFDIESVAKGVQPEDLEFLYKCINNNCLADIDIEKAAELATGGFLYEPVDGAWAMISRRFLEATSPNSAIYCYTSLANLERTWAKVEVVTLLSELPDEQVVGNTTAGELRKLIGNNNDLTKVYDEMIKDSQELVNETKVYIDGEGNLIGSSNSHNPYNGDSIFDVNINDIDNVLIYYDANGKIVGITTQNSKYIGTSEFSTRLSQAVNYSKDEVMKKRYKDFDSLNAIDKIKIKQYDYEKRTIADMIKYNSNSSKGIDILTIDELKLKYDFITDATDKLVIAELQLIEYRSNKYGANSNKGVSLLFDDTGSVIGVDNEHFKSISASVTESDVKFKVAVEEYHKFSSDSEMNSQYKKYNELTPIEKLEAKQLDLDIRNISIEYKDVDISSTTLNKYLAATGKKIDDLDIVDKVVLKCSDSMSNGGKMEKSVSAFVSKCDGLSNVAKKALPVADFLFTGIEFISVCQEVNEYYEKGEYSKATEIMVKGALSEAGGYAFTGLTAPYLVGAGAVIAGPIGIIAGTLISGIISYSVADEIVGDLYDLGETIGEWLFGSWNKAANATPPADPLILDMDGDGFNIETRKLGVNFDLNCDGFAEKINWTSKDGILSYDMNANGKIDNGREVFGDYHLLADGSRAKNGFTALLQYDANGDGIIDENDEIYNKLCVWIDADCDGTSDSGELKSLKDAGIVAIKLNYIEENRTTDTEALIGNVATFIYNDAELGKVEREIGEMWVSSDMYNAIETMIADVSGTVEGLPNVRSYGKVSSLHAAIAEDKTGTLQALVEDYVAEEDTDARMTIVEDILWFMCDANSVDKDSRGGWVDARKLKVVESFMGQSFMGINGANPIAQAAGILNKSYDEIVKMYYFSMIGSTISDVVNYITIKEDKDGNVTYDTTLFNIALNAGIVAGIITKRQFMDAVSYVGYIGSRVHDDLSMIYETREYFVKHAPEYVELVDESIYGAVIGTEAEREELRGTANAEAIIGRGGKDVIIGGAGSDMLIGEEGDDYIEGNDGHDIINAGTGNDDIEGEGGNDTIYAGEGDDVIEGNDGNDIIYGDEGNDEIWGWNGNDTICGGKGNDRIYGGRGIDRFVFSLGDGIDTLEGGDDINWREDRIFLGEGIDPEDIELTREEDDLIITNTNSGDMITIKRAYARDTGIGFIGGIIFADGTEWGLEELKNNRKYIRGTEENDSLKGFDEGFNNNTNEIFVAGAGNDYVYGNLGNDTIYGGDGADIIYGNDGNDIIYGEKGNDVIQGDKGIDTYIINLGDGADTIYNNDSNNWKEDKIIFGEGISPDDIELSRIENDLIIKNIKSGEKLTLQYAFNSGAYLVGGIIFADGTEWGLEELKNNRKYIRGTEENDSLKGFDKGFNNNTNEIFVAGAGNDYVYGNLGNDTIYGGDGADIIYGDDGNDVIYGEQGNDIMLGRAGIDRYIFNLGDGIDDIDNGDSANWKNDRIVFGEGITADDVILERKGDNIIIHYGNKGDMITIKYAYTYDNGYNLIGGIQYSDGTEWDTNAILHMHKYRFGTNGNDNFIGYTNGYSYNGSEIYKTGEGDDTVSARTGDDIVYGEEGNDKLYGDVGNDILYGGDGNDTMQGGEGNDTLYGDKGNDTFIGNNGNDTYTFNLGDGLDTIDRYDSSSLQNDRISFGDRIRLEDVVLERSDNDLIFNYGDNDRVTVKNAYGNSNGNNYIGSVEFADETILETDELKAIHKHIKGTGNSDNIAGYESGYGYNTSEIITAGVGDDVVSAGTGNDTIYGEVGNDTLYGETGDDTIYGGTGNDTLAGGAGIDRYVFNLGDGEDIVDNYDETHSLDDKIVFGEGISSKDVRVSRETDELIIKYGNADDKIIIRNAYGNEDGYNYIGALEFADGSKLSIDELCRKLTYIVGTDKNDCLDGFENSFNTSCHETFRSKAGDDFVRAGAGNDRIYGGEGNDRLIGDEGNDTIYGDEGNDMLAGDEGNDTYVFSGDFGQDRVYDYDGENVIVFLGKIKPEDIVISSNSLNDITLTVRDTDKSVTLGRYMCGKNWRNYTIKFNDGRIATVDVRNGCLEYEERATYTTGKNINSRTTEGANILSSICNGSYTTDEYMTDVATDLSMLVSDSDNMDAYTDRSANLLIQELAGATGDNIYSSNENMTTNDTQLFVEQYAVM